MEILWKGTVSTKFPAIRLKLRGNCVFSQNFHTSQEVMWNYDIFRCVAWLLFINFLQTLLSDDSILKGLLIFISNYSKLVKPVVHTGLSKTRWIERYKAYRNYLVIHKFVVSAFESIVGKKLYSEFYWHLETKIHEKWSWYQESQSLFSSFRRLDRLAAFTVLVKGLEILKLLVKNLQERNQDIYEVFYI